jgi:VWFA-related protein
MSLSSRCLPLLIGVCAMLAQQAARPQRAPAPRASKKKSDKTPPLPPRSFFVDAVAETADGRPVPDLTAADFSLTLAGEPKKIAGVSFVNTEAGTISPASSRIALKPDQIRRTLVFLVDDLGLNPDGAQNVRRVLTGFLERQMRPNDLVSIIRTASGSGTLQKLTADRRELAQAVAAIQYNPEKGGEEVFASGARGVLTQVLEDLRSQPGRKGVVLLSGNPSLFEKSAADQLALGARGSSAVVSAIDVRGASAPALTSNPAILPLIARSGGRFLTGTDDLSASFSAVLRDQQAYYLISYESEPGDAAGLLHVLRLAVATRRPGVVLRFHDAFINSDNFTSAAEGNLWRPSFTTPAADLRRGLVDLFTANPIPIRFSAAWGLGKSGGEIQGHLFIDTKDLTYTHWLNGRITAILDIQVAAFNENGLSMQNDTRSYTLQLNNEQFQESAGHGFTASPFLLGRSPGAYQVRVSVRDGTSGRVGSASQFVEVPDLSAGQLAVAGIASVAVEKKGANLAPLHIFQHDLAYKYTYQVLNLSADENKRSQMEAQLFILRDGQPIFGSKPANVPFSPSEDPRRRVAEAEVKIADLAPGFYILEFRVSDKLARGPRTASQFSRFEVQ